MKTCNDCRFFVRHDEGKSKHGRCYALPPTLLIRRIPPRRIKSYRPEVHEDDQMCGSWRESDEHYYQRKKGGEF